MTGQTLTGSVQQPSPTILKSDYAIPIDYVAVFLGGFLLGFYLCFKVATGVSFKSLT